jgi:hypothetical protein
MHSRRRFLIDTPLGLLGTIAACRGGQQVSTPAAVPAELPPGAPGTVGTGPAVGPAVSRATFAEAEKLAQVTLTASESEQAVATWSRIMAPLLERRVGPRRVALERGMPPATVWDPRIAGTFAGPTQDRFVRSPVESKALPSDEAAIAFAPVTQLAHWIEWRSRRPRRPTPR